MLKKMIGLFIVSLLSVTVFAPVVLAEDRLPDEARNLPSSGEFILENEEEEGVSTQSTCTPTYHFTVELNDPLFGTPNALGKSTAYENCGGTLKYNDIDLVSVKTKLYRNGGINSTNNDITRNGHYAGARTELQGSSSRNLEAYGEHRFKQEGIMEHTFNTYDK